MQTSTPQVNKLNLLGKQTHPKWWDHSGRAVRGLTLDLLYQRAVFYQ